MRWMNGLGVRLRATHLHAALCCLLHAARFVPRGVSILYPRSLPSYVCLDYQG